jgi:hypothetical protein
MTPASAAPAGHGRTRRSRTARTEITDRDDHSAASSRPAAFRPARLPAGLRPQRLRGRLARPVLRRRPRGVLPQPRGKVRDLRLKFRSLLAQLIEFRQQGAQRCDLRIPLAQQLPQPGISNGHRPAASSGTPGVPDTSGTTPQPAPVIDTTRQAGDQKHEPAQLRPGAMSSGPAGGLIY